MPEWEAFYFCNFFLNGYLVLVFDNLSHAEVLAPYLQS